MSGTRDAFAARLKRMQSKDLVPPDLKMGDSVIASPLPEATKAVLPPSPVVAPLSAEPSTRTPLLSGWLLKQSTGNFSRWQKRWFVLVGGYLGYFRSPQESLGWSGAASQSILQSAKPPLNSPSPHKAYPIALCTNVVIQDKELVLFFSEKEVHLQGVVATDALRWCAAIQTAISAHAWESSQSAPAQGISPIAVFPDDDVQSVASSIAAPPPPTSEKNSVLAEIWEIDSDNLDRSFAQWFACLEGSEPWKVSGLVDAIGLMEKDLFTHKGAPIHALAGEYFARLAPLVSSWLDTFATEGQISPENLQILCVLAELRLAASAGLSPINVLIDRLTADLEISLILKIRAGCHTDGVWEGSVSNHATLDLSSPHGPSISFSPIYPGRPLFLSSWFPAFVSAMDSVSKELGLWSSRYPKAAPLLAEVRASALVAGINTAWRRFHRRVCRAVAQAAEREELKTRNFISRWRAIRNRSVTPGEDDEGLPLINFKWENAIGFANEASLMNDFAYKSKDKAFPEVYGACLDGLSGAFTGFRNNAIKRMVSELFLDKSVNVAVKLFSNKKLVTEGGYSIVRGIVPIVKTFLSEVSVAAHELVESRILIETMRAVIAAYCLAFARAGLKLSKCPTLGQVMVQDEVAYAEFFAKHYNKLANDTKPLYEPITKLRTTLTSQSPVKMLPTITAYLMKTLGSVVGSATAFGIADCLELSPNEREIVERATRDGIALAKN